MYNKEAAQTCRRRGVGGTCGACTGPRRVLVLSRLARRARAAVGPRATLDARAKFLFLWYGNQLQLVVFTPWREDLVGLVIHETEPRVGGFHSAEVILEAQPRLVAVFLYQLSSPPILKDVLMFLPL